MNQESIIEDFHIILVQKVNIVFVKTYLSKNAKEKKENF